MKIEKTLKEFKKDYERMKPSAAMRVSGWDVLEERMEKEELRMAFKLRLGRYAFLTAATIGFLLVAGGGVAVASWNAKPGDALYPVKVFSEKIAHAVVPSAVPTQAPEPTKTEPDLAEENSVATYEPVSTAGVKQATPPLIAPQPTNSQNTPQSVIENVVQQIEAPKAAESVKESVSGVVQGAQNVVRDVLPLLP